jgi:hypothetical protein
MNIEKLKEEFKLVDGVLYQLKLGKRSVPEWELAIRKEYTRYHRVYFDGKTVSTHKVIWALANGREPVGQIDHRDGNIHNNHPDNLREVTCRGNAVNKKVHREGKLPGGYLTDRGNYQALVHIGKEQLYLGRFDSEQEANEIYNLAVSLIPEFDGDYKKFRDLVRSRSRFEFAPPSGCSLRKGRGSDKWEASIYVGDRNVFLGSFSTEEIATEFYNKAKELKDQFESPDQFRDLLWASLPHHGSRNKPKGCTYNKSRGKWAVQFQVNGTKMSLGLYGTEEEAVRVYKKADELRPMFVDKIQFKELVLG